MVLRWELDAGKPADQTARWAFAVQRRAKPTAIDSRCAGLKRAALSARLQIDARS